MQCRSDLGAPHLHCSFGVDLSVCITQAPTTNSFYHTVAAVSYLLSLDITLMPYNIICIADKPMCIPICFWRRWCQGANFLMQQSQYIVDTTNTLALTCKASDTQCFTRARSLTHPLLQVLPWGWVGSWGECFPSSCSCHSGIRMQSNSCGC